MHGERSTEPGWRRRGRQAAVTLLGLLAIVGSGGGSLEVGPLPPLPTVEVVPAATTVQVGSNAVFEVRTTNLSQPTYTWCRIPDGGTTCTVIAGAASARHGAVGANLADDGARYRVSVSGVEGVFSAVGHLAVSSMPGVGYSDGEFLASEWAVSAVVEPEPGGPSHTTARAASGGHPGAFQETGYVLTSVPSSVTLFHRALSASYEPAAQGAIYRIDFSEDCSGLSSTYLPCRVPFIQQGERWYVAHSPARRTCTSPAWQAVGVRSSLSDQDFVLVQGPACSSGESCPDFSTDGAAIGLGLVSAARLSSVLPPGTTAHFAHGFDNWNATVWRR